MASKLLLIYLENTLDIHENTVFNPRVILDNKYLVNWEHPDNAPHPDTYQVIMGNPINISE